MHLGFHIYDVGFQSRNAEAGKPMVFMTTLLLISLVGVMNALAIAVRNRLKRKYYVGHF
jgi:phosphate transport system permease protein